MSEANVSNVREQFEAWWNTERMATAFHSFKHVAEEAFAAGHAASGRDELLDQVEAFCVRTYNAQQKAIASGSDSLDWHLGYKAAMSEIASMIDNGKKAKGEA